MALQRSTAPFKDLPSFPRLTHHYLANDPDLKSFYNHPAGIQGIKELTHSFSFNSSERKSLVETFKKQYKGLVSDKKVEENLQLLSNENSFTVCTGHQCCLFTGPLYFIGKIINAIVLSKELNSKIPGKSFIPVLWLHTEDHDLDEIDHIYLFGKVIRWEHGQTGSAGDLKLETTEKTLSEIELLINKEAFGASVMTLLRKYYIPGSDLATATRGFVNELFGKYGLLILDPRHADLKNLFKDTMAEEVFENSSEKILTKVNAQLGKLGYEPSVNPREINLFYLSPGKRERIVKSNGGFQTKDESKKWTAEEIQMEIDTLPENFSPNVILRPVYQQRILPNVAYVGGPAEIAYWLQFKAVLDHWKAPFPILIHRNIVFWFNTARAEKWSSLGLKPNEILLPEDTLVSKLLAESPNGEAISRTTASISAEMKKLGESLAVLDASLKAAVGAEENRTIKGLQHLQQKLNKSLKSREEVRLNKMRAVLNRLLPNGVPEERTENFIHWYAVMGPQFFDTLIENFEIFPENIILLTEQN